MKKFFSIALCFLIFSAFAGAEYRVTPFGVFDSGDSGSRTKVNYNVKTENGVETRERFVDTKQVETKEGLAKLMKEIGKTKFVLSPADAPANTVVRKSTIYLKPEAKSTPVQFRTRVFNRVKSLIIMETRKFYKSKVPKAIAPLGSFLNASGGSMVLTDKEKRPLGTLIISYAYEFVEPTEDECESYPFFTVSEIPGTWKGISETVSDWDAYRLPSGEKVLVKHVGKLYRCVGFKAEATVTFTYNKLGK